MAEKKVIAGRSSICGGSHFHIRTTDANDGRSPDKIRNNRNKNGKEIQTTDPMLPRRPCCENDAEVNRVRTAAMLSRVAHDPSSRLVEGMLLK